MSTTPVTHPTQPIPPTHPWMTMVEADAKKVLTFGLAHLVLMSLLFIALLGANYLYVSKRAEIAELKATAAETQAKKADTDNDGKVSFDEMKAMRPQMTKEQFDMRDRNKDGVLTAADFPSPADLFKEADKDGDGKVIFEEMNAVRPLPKERFDMMDKNKDGVLTPDEMRMGPRPGGMMGHVSGMGLR